MAVPLPFVRTAGDGPAVLCLHSTGSSSRQWSRLAERLSPRFRVITADLVAHGKSRPWARGEAPSIDAEIDALSAVVEAHKGTMHVVGHSYGGAVAIRLALRHPGRIATVTAYEPVMFRQLLDACPDDDGALEAVRVAGQIHAALGTGRAEEGARLFFDYWSGEGAWLGLEEDARRALAQRLPTVLACFQALFADRTPRAALARLQVPTLLMSGGRSPASGRATTKLLADVLPKAWWKAFPELGHMGPVESPDRVNEQIERFLEAAHRRSVAFRPFDTGPFPGWGATAAA